MKRLALLALLAAAPLFAQPSKSPLTRGLADSLYAKLLGGSSIAGTTTFTNLTVTGTCTGCGSSSGTVTSVSVVTANGVSGSVATATTTPAITLTLGAITPTTVNGNTFTTGTYTLTGAGGKVFTFNNTMTLAGTDGQTYTLPSTSATIARTDVAQIFTGHNTFEGVTPTGATGTGKFVFDTGPTITSLIPTFTDVTTGNVSITAHGLAPKGDNVATHFLDGTGAYTTPAGGITNAAGANVIPKSDGTNLVASGITNTSGGALTTAAGIVFSATTTAAAATASSTAGVGLTITADPAVAGSSNAGAAAGGAVTITSGDAKRLTSGNAAGGAINLTTGAGIGTGAVGNINFNGYMRPTAAADANLPQFGMTSPFVSGISVTSTCGTCIYSGGSTLMQVVNGGIGMGSGYLGFTATDALGTKDLAVSRAAAGTLAVGTGAAANRQGFIQTGGDCFVAADVTNATATMATTTCLVGATAITVTSGRKYTGVCEFFLSDSTAVDGAQIDFNGGSAAATNFRAQVTAFDTALNLSTQVSALATASSASTFTGAGAFEVHFSFEPSGNGTFLPRFAQNAHTTGTLTLARGSNCRVHEM